jgi:hypothetical protein
MTDAKPIERDRRILKHIKALADAGTDVKKFVSALQSVRTDNALNHAQKVAIYKTLAQEAAVGYRYAMSGKALDLGSMQAANKSKKT